MNWLEECLRSTFPAPDAAPGGTSFVEKGLTFSIRKNLGETVAMFHLDSDGARNRRPPGVKVCDLLFVCIRPGRPSALLLFVELKGADLSAALTQLDQTFSRLCKRGHGHHDDAIPAIREKYPGISGHNGRALGFVVRRQGGHIDQKRVKALSRRGLHLVVRTGSQTDVTIKELVKHVPGSSA